MADHVAVLDYSVLRACCSVDTFRERVCRVVARFPSDPPLELPSLPGLLQATRDGNELSLIMANATGHTHRALESAGAFEVDEQPVGLEEALIAYVGRQGKKSHLLQHLGDNRSSAFRTGDVPARERAP